MTEEEFYNSFPNQLKEELAIFETLPKEQRKEALQEILKKYRLKPATFFYLLVIFEHRNTQK